MYTRVHSGLHRTARSPRIRETRPASGARASSMSSSVHSEKIARASMNLGSNILSRRTQRTYPLTSPFRTASAALLPDSMAAPMPP